VLVISIALHAVGALKHHFVDKDTTLRRMWFGTHVAATPPAKAHRTSLPIVTATTLWAVAVGVGGMVGVYDSHTPKAPQAAALEQVASDWTVTEGTLSITVTQFGNQVTGSFADWTAAIRFDPGVRQGTAGDVTATVSIPSLTLGSVTAQAMGPDFFDATTHATAVFEADIVTIPDGYAAEGTLTLKGQTLPLTLPLRLIIRDGIATLDADVTLNRLDYGIGANMPDESSLAFAVDVTVALTATRTAD